MARHSSTYRCNRVRPRPGAARRAALTAQRLAALAAQQPTVEERVVQVSGNVEDLETKRRERKNELARARRAAKKVAA